MNPQVSAIPPSDSEGHSQGEDGTLQLLFEEWHTVPKVFS
jgi:hypothetical protein